MERLDLKVQIAAFGKTVVGHIEQQDPADRFDCNSSKSNTTSFRYKGKDSITLVSQSYPQINPSRVHGQELWLLGDKRYERADDEIFTCRFDSPEEARSYVIGVRKTIIDFNDRGGFEVLPELGLPVNSKWKYVARLENTDIMLFTTKPMAVVEYGVFSMEGSYDPISKNHVNISGVFPYERIEILSRGPWNESVHRVKHTKS